MRRIFLLACFAAALAATSPAEARGGRFGGDDRGNWDNNEARDAVERGRHVPLRQILEEVRRRYPGRQLGADLQGGDPATYVILWLTEDGRRLRILANAETGRILSVSPG